MCVARHQSGHGRGCSLSGERCVGSCWLVGVASGGGALGVGSGSLFSGGEWGGSCGGVQKMGVRVGVECGGLLFGW